MEKVSVPISTNGLDRSQYSDAKWKEIEQAASYNQKILQEQENAKQIEKQKIEAFNLQQKQLAEKYQQEQKAREQWAKQYVEIQQKNKRLPTNLLMGLQTM